MSTARLKYNTSLTVDLTVLAVKGASEPDHVSKFPSNLVFNFLDGSIAEQVKAGRREISISFHIMTLAERRKLVSWWLDPDKLLICTLTKCATPSYSLIIGSLTGTFWYRIVAIDPVGESEASDYVEQVTDGDGVRLTWAGQADARGYKILRSDDSGTTWDLKDYTTETTYDDKTTSVIWVDVDYPTKPSEINMVVPDDLVFDWAGDTELNRLCTINGRDATVFPRTSPFPV